MLLLVFGFIIYELGLVSLVDFSSEAGDNNLLAPFEIIILLSEGI